MCGLGEAKRRSCNKNKKILNPFFPVVKVQNLKVHIIKDYTPEVCMAWGIAVNKDKLAGL